MNCVGGMSSWQLLVTVIFHKRFKTIRPCSYDKKKKALHIFTVAFILIAEVIFLHSSAILKLYKEELRVAPQKIGKLQFSDKN